MTRPPGGDTEAIRALVREVLAELLPTGARDPGNPGTAGSPWPEGLTARDPGDPGTAGPRPGVLAARPGPVAAGPTQPGLPHTVREDVESVQAVSIRSDADLGNFVLHLLRLFENPKHRDALRAGRLRFRLAAPAASGSAPPSHRIEKGAVTEAMVAASARDGARLVLGRRAVLTPLARDRARAAGVEIVKER